MRVTVRLFARLRDIAGAPELAREVAPGATIGSVWRQLVGDFPEFARYEQSISSAVNADYARMDQAAAATATRSRFCRRYRGDRRSRAVDSDSYGRRSAIVCSAISSER